MHEMTVCVTFGGRRGWIEALPGLDWVRLVLTASVLVDVHFVLASVARQAKRTIVLGVGLRSDWGRIGLDWALFSFVFVVIC